MTFTEEDILTAMRKVVAEKGSDYRYPQSEGYQVGELLPGGEEVLKYSICRYASDGKPSCIVGHVVAELDPEAFAQLASQEEERGPEAATGLVGYGYLPSDWCTYKAQQALVAAQIQQDSKFTWAAALAAAEG